MRIVGGEFGGRRLTAPTSNATRPTSDRAREALFNKLQHRHNNIVDDARVLDLFAGTGALGIEALSRGASFAQFVESSADARAVIRTNIEAFGLQGRTKIFRRDATRLGSIGTQAPFNLIFADPPYGKGLGETALASALNGGWFSADTLCVVEEDASSRFEFPDAFVAVDRLMQGGTVLHILRLRSS